MAISMREKYKVEVNQNTSNVEKAYSYQRVLKSSREYEEKVDNTFMQIVEIFRKTYPNIKIEPPREREKSNKSLKSKIENLEIERLCKLYAIGEITEKEYEDLYKAILRITDGEEQENIYKICLEEIENLDSIDIVMQNEKISEKIKTSLLRIIKTKLLNQEQTHKCKMLLKKLDKKYGKGAVARTRQLKDDLLRWESIEKLSKSDIEKLHNPMESLKVKDLRGFKIAIASVPADLKTNNKKLQKLLQIRERAKVNDRAKIDDMCNLELAKEFAYKLINSPELLKQLNIQVLPCGYKHKEKQNGYMAEHIKFCYIDKPEYTFEFQIHSLYREDLTLATGSADHANRFLEKARQLSNTENEEEFIRNENEKVPRCKYIEITEDGEQILHKCTMAQNMADFYLGYAPYEEIQKGIEIFKKKEEMQELGRS